MMTATINPPMEMVAIKNKNSRSRWAGNFRSIWMRTQVAPITLLFRTKGTVERGKTAGSNLCSFDMP